MDDTRLKIRLAFGDGPVMGPGKAALLDGIRNTGSIAGAGRAMGMSYKRAWSLVEEMNAMFRTPLVERHRGGAKGGSARLTPLGDEVLAAFRGIEAKARQGAATEIAFLERSAAEHGGEN